MSYPVPHNTPEWHAARRGKITASLAPAILVPGETGVHGNPFTAWLRICRPDEAEDVPQDDEAAEFGRESEHLHATLLGRRSGIEWTVMQPGFLVDEEIPWLGASPDLLGVRESDGAEVVAELMAPTNYAIKRELRERMPINKVIQLAVQMRVWKKPLGCVSVLFAPSPTWQMQERASDFEAYVLEGLTRFYERFVLTDTPPPLHDEWLDDKTLKAFKAINPPRENVSVYFDELHAGTSAAMGFEEAKREIAKWEKHRQAAEAALIEAAGNAEAIYLPDGSGYTRKTQVRKVKAQEARTDTFTVLRRKERMDGK